MIGIKNQHFGVEIEMTGITRQEAAEALATFLNGTANYAGGNYCEWNVNDSQGRKWKLVSDGSIRPERKTGTTYTTKFEGFRAFDYKVELVTPKLKYEDIETLQEAVRRIRKAGAKVNSSCGIHIHVDAKNHTAKSAKNLINIMYAKEDLLFKALAVNPDREHYCKKIRETLVKDLQAADINRMSLGDIADLWYKGNVESRSYHYNSTRYAALNLHSVWFKGTVEFRLFNSTLHAGEIKSYIQLALAISAQAINQKTTQVKKTRSSNEKFTFRTWLLHLGLIGDEFETARLHLLKNLEGNSAWRHVGGM